MIGAGIFVLPGQLAPYGWMGLAAWAVVIPGALILAAVISRLIAARPGATGAAAIIGETLGPLPGVLISWSYWVGIWSANAIIAQTAIRYLAVFEPKLASSDITLAFWSIVLIWLLTLLNLAGAKAAGRFQVVTTLLKLLPLLAVIVIGAQILAFGEGGRPATVMPPAKISDLTPALALAFYALVGFEAAGVAAERVKDPARNIGRATMLGVALTGVFYLLVCASIMFGIPTEQAANSPAPVALFVETYWGHWASLGVAAFAVIATVGCLNGWILVQGEVPLSMARAGQLPKALAVTNSRDVPVRLLVLASVCASVLLASSANAEGGLLGFMLNLTAAATLWLYIGSCLAAIRMRVGVGLAFAGLAFSIWALVGSGTSAALLSILLMVAALPLYWWAKRSGAAQPATEG